MRIKTAVSKAHLYQSDKQWTSRKSFPAPKNHAAEVSMIKRKYRTVEVIGLVITGPELLLPTCIPRL